jgi:hypothetical protein
MADKNSLRAIGYMFGAVTAAVTIIAVVFVANVEPGRGEPSEFAYSAAMR